MKKGFAFFLILSTLILKSQSTYVGGAFPTIDHSGTLTNKLHYDFYYFAAFPIVDLKKPNINKNANFLLLYFEQSLSYKLSEHFSLTGSYVYQRANVVYDNYVNENRVYIQATYKQSTQHFNIKHRLRFDARFIQNRITDETPFTHRLRYLIGIDTPLNKKLYFTAYEEAFFNTFKGSGAVYGENWTFAGIGKKLNEKNKIELGILYITWNTGSNNWFNQFYLQCAWVSHIDFRKNKPS